MNARAFINETTATISRDFPLLAGGLLANQLADDDPLWEWAEVAADHVLRLTDGDQVRLDECAEAFVITSLDFIRLQARFMKTGRYAHGSQSETVELYGDDARMSEYLDGLALSYCMWRNHTMMLKFYVENFLPGIPQGSTVLEVGPGHGLLAAVLLNNRPDVSYLGLDISPRSISYSAAAFRAAGVDERRYDLQIGDASAPSDNALCRSWDAAICCEVLEHVDEPGDLLGAVGANARSGARMFVSTVANMEAPDHVFLFTDVAHIRGLLIASGFEILDDQPLPLAGSEHLRPCPTNYSGILSRS